MLKIASLTLSSLIIASSLYVGPAAATTTAGREVAASTQTVEYNGCGWGRHWSYRWGHCVRNW